LVIAQKELCVDHPNQPKVIPVIFRTARRSGSIFLADIYYLKSDEFSALLIDARGLWPIAR
jgi:hypothetical protein